VNALKEKALLERFGVGGLSEHDGNASRPVYRFFADDGQMLEEPDGEVRRPPDRRPRVSPARG
jgi:hypothetical protein